MRNERENVIAVIVKQGHLLDYIDGKTQRKETPEEHVRQEIAKSLVREYGYDRSDVAVEFSLRTGRSSRRADLVVFRPGMPHKQENALLVVECKQPKTNPDAPNDKGGVGQLKAYLSVCPNATHGLWTNGEGGARICLRRVERDGLVVLDEVADIPLAGEDEAGQDRPHFDQLRPATSDALLFAFRRCHDYIAGNQGMKKEEAFWELLKLIFCKIHDEDNSDEVEFYATPKERHGPNGPQKVAKRIGGLFDAVKASHPRIFSGNDKVELKPVVLAHVVSQLQIYTLLGSDVDVKGKAYEEVVGPTLRGEHGAFFTPRNVCRMAVEMLAPGEDELVLDPACGTGGFLITAMNHVVEKIRVADAAKWKKNQTAPGESFRRRSKTYAKNKIVGIDFNASLVKAAKMNMVMNNDGEGGLFQANSLLPPMKWDDDLRSRKLMGGVDLIFTNPPFGSKIPVDDPATLEQYDLARIWSYDAAADEWIMGESFQASQPPEILFVERCVQFLKPGTGRMAVVLPDSILGSPGLGYVRQWIMRNTEVLASVDLHGDAFQPSVSVQTSVLVLRRKSEEQVKLEDAARRLNEYAVFMALAEHVGHDKRGKALYVRDADGNEIVEETDETIKDEDADGDETPRVRKVLRKVPDDNTLQIAQVFRTWLSERE